jgi:uncharacterized membrane protein
MRPFTATLRLVGQCFLAGVFAILPLAITVAIVIWAATFIGQAIGPDTLVGKAIGSFGLQVTSDSTLAYLLGWTIVLGVIFGLGVLVQMGAKRFVSDRLGGLIARVPLIGGLYGTASQLVGMLDKQQKSDLKGMTVVYCVFGQETGAAFLALMPTPEKFRIGQVDYRAVLIPTAPVPFGGSLLFVPADSVHPADLSVDAFMSIYVSMGVTGPQFLAKTPG